MLEQQAEKEFLPESGEGKVADIGGNGQSGNAPPQPTPEGSTPAESACSKKLTAEEQMALYEKELKENDWGHQPC